MALKHSKQLYLQLNNYGKRSLFPALGSNSLNVLSVVHYSVTGENSKDKLSKAMKAHLEKAERFGKFMKDQLAEYELGREFLTNMMGKKSGLLTETEVNEAIEYLFPSALFVPKSRPIMKPPQDVFTKQRDAEFDYSGRPFHFLFYTSKPNYAQCLHDTATCIEKLNEHSKKNLPPPQPLILTVGRWISKEELEKVFLEKLFDIEYEKLLEALNRLLEHPFASMSEKFIKTYWITQESKSEYSEPLIWTNSEGIKFVKVEGLRRKTGHGTVVVKYPGVGKFRINKLRLDYFKNLQRREQVSLRDGSGEFSLGPSSRGKFPQLNPDDPWTNIEKIEEATSR